MSELAIPLAAVVTLHAGTFQVGLLRTMEWLPWLLIGLPAGAIVDRFSRRSMMLGWDIVFVLVLASVPVAGWLGVLGIGQLLLVAFVMGTGGVFFSTAYTAYLPLLVDRGDLAEGNAKLQGSESATQVGGPGLAGLIAQAFGAVTGVLADAVSCVVSLGCLLAIRTREPRPEARHKGALVREIADGARFTFRDSYLRTFALFGAGSNLMMTGLEAIQVVFLIRVVGVNAGVVGVLGSLATAGGVVGALFSSRIARRLGTARALLLCELGLVPFAVLIPMTHQGIRLACYVAGFTLPIAGIIAGNIIIGAFRQEYCPPALLGRVIAGGRFLAYGTIPLGALLAGTLGTVFGLRPTMWVMAVGIAVMPLVLLTGPIRHHRDLPSRPRPDTVPGGESLPQRTR